MSAVTPDIRERVHEAIASIDDPEYPGVSIVDLGLLERVEITHGNVSIGLIPTFSGCPALHIIRDDVTAAVEALDDIEAVTVEWLRAPAWSPDRVTEAGRRALAAEFTVAVQVSSRPTACPRCASPTELQSLFGPSRCRSVHRCTTCSETVEVLRG